ncbi:hypothetical protein COI87_21915 [Bacillus thuringiensis]|nr:hypothetical protein AT261_28585 [Bacillus cereus]PFJ09620.1 hypothetical protein COI87_21915 [Bacillus thuringiensis]PGX82172.1 hypothetical protein COE45_15505 [Bacillus thuringiensis]
MLNDMFFSIPYKIFFFTLFIKGIVLKHRFDFLLFALYDYQVVLGSSHSVENIVK